MKRPATASRDRLLSVILIALCMGLLGVVASTLTASVSTTVAPKPPSSTPPSGISLFALLYQLLNQILAPFGISLGPHPGQFSGDSLLGLVFIGLRALYQYRLLIIAIAFLFTVVGLLYQYCYHLAVPRPLQPTSESAEIATEPSSTATPSAGLSPETPSGSVQAAWVAMIRRVDADVDKPSSRTAIEWQQIAIDAGLPPDAVKTITATFREVQYGDASETDARRHHVRVALERLDEHQEATYG
ncbi:DUF4129 domain-containing protein [Natrinema ejinorense]|uniref:DUF4129 domain-containing protein n=1 Tax=Natrinema ejinorense TaxID=373386 RepID=UPI001B80DCF5|nr:DUF4129 domain-containing protein [Natrinema ejinorense]